MTEERRRFTDSPEYTRLVDLTSRMASVQESQEKALDKISTSLEVFAKTNANVELLLEEKAYLKQKLCTMEERLNALEDKLAEIITSGKVSWKIISIISSISVAAFTAAAWIYEHFF